MMHRTGGSRRKHCESAIGQKIVEAGHAAFLFALKPFPENGAGTVLDTLILSHRLVSMSAGSPFRFPKALDWWNVCDWGTAATKLPQITVLVQSQTEKYDAKHPPKFEDYPAAEVWNGTPASLKLTARSERMFRTKLTDAANEPPNFAGHYRFAVWGCGAECISGAVIDLQTGQVLSPPTASKTAHFSVCQSAYEKSGIDIRLDSRLMIVRCGLNYSERLQENVPDAYYFVWEDNRFRKILFISGKEH